MPRRRDRTPRERSPHGRSQRQLKVGEEIRHIIADILLRESFHEPALDETGGVTVSEVSVSPDLANADVFVVPLGGNKHEGDDGDGVLDALTRIAPQIRNLMAQRLATRRAPKLRFIADTTLDNADRIESIIAANSASRGGRDS